MIPKLICFSDWIEWAHVYDLLYCSDNALNQTDGVERVKGWKLRGKVPLGIDATAQLVELKLLDARQGCTMECLRLAYSMCIVRVVNGLVDEFQSSAYALSISLLADRLGIPKWIVDIRHDATHNAMPSIDVLRMACNELLNYLNESYWKRQLQVLQDSRPSVEKIQQTLIEVNDCCAIVQKLLHQVPDTSNKSSSDKHSSTLQSNVQLLDSKVDYLCSVFSENNIASNLVSLLLHGFQNDTDGSYVYILLPEQNPELNKNSFQAEGFFTNKTNLQKIQAITGKYERMLAGLNDAFDSFTSSLFDSICSALLDQDTKSDDLHDGDYIYSQKFYLLSWCYFLLSKKWHSLSDASLGKITNKRNLCKLNDRDISLDEFQWFLSSAAKSYQEASNLRVKHWFKLCLNDTTGSVYVKILIHMFSNILKDNSNDSSIANLIDLHEQSSTVKALPQPTSDDDDDDDDDEAEITSEPLRKKDQDQFVSIDQLESFCDSHFVGSQEDSPDKAADVAETQLLQVPCIALSTVANKTVKVEVAKWTLVSDWEKCAIGKLPHSVMQSRQYASVGLSIVPPLQLKQYQQHHQHQPELPMETETVSASPQLDSPAKRLMDMHDEEKDLKVKKKIKLF